MTAILHQLRSRSRALAHGLLLVLLATWLAAACPHCLAQAAEAAAPAPAAHCHDEAPPAELPLATHDCCAEIPFCAETGCAQLSAMPVTEPAAYVIAEPASAIAPAIPASADAYPATPPPAVPLVQRVAIDSCPLYLRHCSLLN